MEEFEAGTKRRKIDEGEKTVYPSKTPVEKPEFKPNLKTKTKKRDVKDGVKQKNYKYKHEKEEDEELMGKIKELKRFYNQLRVKKGDLKPNKEQKVELVNNCLEILGEDFKKFAFKHDSCRVLQSMIKHGNVEQKTLIIAKCMDMFTDLMTNKYSHHLAYRIVQYCSDETQKKNLISIVISKIGTLIMHMFASEVVELLYSSSIMRDKKQMIHAFYGNYFLILQENKGKSLKALLKEKPALKDGIQGKLENLAHKLIDKGLTRHTIVQAIIYDYVSI
mmetsp:Transcript_35480/g.41045  ORF Transcript_35480/g.41045 Transcript_35480/m.41045 type:complete len:277 (-) Transcript_35480:998-1828(-)